MAFEHFNTTPPADLVPPVADNSQATPPTEVTPPESGTPPAETTPPMETAKPDLFFDEFNKRYNTKYKGDEDLKGLINLTGKVSEYETKVKDYDTIKGDVEKYKKELDEVKTTYMSDLLAKPRLRSAYVAQQLIEKYPDRDPDVLGELAMSDIDKMSDIEILARERKMRGSKSSLDNIKLVIRKELGVDPEQKPEEWDSLVTTELEMKATDARERIKNLLKDIELPKVVTKEEREASQAKFLKDKETAVQPIREVFKKFDTYKNGDFEFEVPEEFKSKLDSVFKGMFIDSGLEVNEKNIATAEMVKKSLFVEEYFSKMLEVHEKTVKAKLKEEQDKLLHNDTPPNTATATDQGTGQDPNKQGISGFFNSQGSGRATKL
jgi:hypothetical protein